jgi:hypothetical protein
MFQRIQKLVFIKLCLIFGLHAGPTFAIDDSCQLSLAQLVEQFFHNTLYASFKAGANKAQEIHQNQITELDSKIKSAKENLEVAVSLLKEEKGVEYSYALPPELTEEPHFAQPSIPDLTTRFIFNMPPEYSNLPTDIKILEFHKKVTEHYFTLGLHTVLSQEKSRIAHKEKVLAFLSQTLNHAEGTLFGPPTPPTPTHNEAVVEAAAEIEQSPLASFVLRDLIGLKPKTNSFKTLSENTFYEFKFEREGSLLNNKGTQYISFTKKVLDWLKEPGHDEAKRKFMDQLELGQASAGAASLGLHPVKDGIYKLKIRTRGHWRMFLKRKSENHWVAFMVTDSENFNPNSFSGLDIW